MKYIPLPHTYQYLDTAQQLEHHNLDHPSENAYLRNEYGKQDIHYFCKFTVELQISFVQTHNNIQIKLYYYLFIW